MIPIGEPIPAVSADYKATSQDRLFNLLGGGSKPSLPNLNLFGGGKKPGSGGKPSYRPPGSRPKPAYNAPSSRPSYKAPSSGYGVPQAPPVGYGVPQAPALSSGYKAPASTGFVTPQNNNLNGLATQDSYSSQKRPNRDSLKVFSNNECISISKISFLHILDCF